MNTKNWRRIAAVIGVGLAATPLVPLAPAGAQTGIRDIAAGFDTSCAVIADGSVKCWGANLAGQLGTLSVQQSATPLTVAGVSNATQVSVGGIRTEAAACAVSTDGRVRCWGYPIGVWSNGRPRTTPTVVPGIEGATKVAVGWGHACALTSTGVKCWGHNEYGQLGNGSTALLSSTPVTVTGLPGTTFDIDAGWSHTCATSSDGRVRCWGWNKWGQLGDGTTENRRTATPVKGIYQPTGSLRLGVGFQHNCVLVNKPDNSSYVSCWGHNDDLQLGDPLFTADFATSPRRVSNLGTASVRPVQVSADGSSCARMSDATVQCWGTWAYPATGSGDTFEYGGRPKAQPATVPGVSASSGLAVGLSHGCAASGSTVTCWGEDSSGQLGSSPLYNDRFTGFTVAL